MTVTAPLALAIALSGGIVALAPLLTIGRAPGLETLERLRERLGNRARAPRELTPKAGTLSAVFRIPGLVHAGPLAGRGPPVPA